MRREEAFRAAFRGAGRIHRVLLLERAFAALHPDYYAVLERGGIWRVVELVQRAAILTSAQQAILDRLRAEPNPAKAAYGLALTRIWTGETE